MNKKDTLQNKKIQLSNKYIEKIQDILQWEKFRKNYIENLPHLSLSLIK